MNNLKRTILPCLLLAASLAGPALAQEVAQLPKAHSRFELSASVMAKPQLSRQEIEPQEAKSDPVDHRQIAALPGRVQQDDSPGAFFKETDVDWSRWVSAEADRWYYCLKTTETELGLQFVTRRPAMIEFTCYADGSIGNVILRQSSGVPAYDRLQMETLIRTMPVPEFPAGTRRSSITLCQGWESHTKREGEQDFQPGSFGRDFPKEKVGQWVAGR